MDRPLLNGPDNNNNNEYNLAKNTIANIHSRNLSTLQGLKNYFFSNMSTYLPNVKPNI